MVSFGKIFLLAWFCFVCLLPCVAYDLAEGERIIQTLEDKLDAENFTYYRLQREGFLKLVLICSQGDVDIFVSSEVQHPSFYNYELKSETCGVDIVTIPSEMSRPVYIGLYGHPRHLHSHFSLSILSIPTPKVTTYEDLVEKFESHRDDESSSDDAYYNEAERKRSFPPDSDKSNNFVEEEVSIWWKIFLGMLEIGLDAIF